MAKYAESCRGCKKDFAELEERTPLVNSHRHGIVEYKGLFCEDCRKRDLRN